MTSLNKSRTERLSEVFISYLLIYSVNTVFFIEYCTSSVEDSEIGWILAARKKSKQRTKFKI